MGEWEDWGNERLGEWEDWGNERMEEWKIGEMEDWVDGKLGGWGDWDMKLKIVLSDTCYLESLINQM